MRSGLKAVILVGGQGTRLQPLTFYVPKPMVPVLNRPFLEHTVAYLKRYGVPEVVLAISYLPEVIRDYFGEGQGQGTAIKYAIEVEPLGTAGAVKNAEQYLDGTFIVLNGDIFSQIDIAEMLKFHRQNKAKATIALTWVDNPSAFGVVETDESGRVKRFIEKPAPGTAATHWINAGAYILEPEVMARVPAGQPYMFERGLFPRMLEAGEPVYGYTFRGYWLDMGTIDKYLRLNCDLLLGAVQSHLVKLADSGISCDDSASISASAQIYGPVLIGRGAKIGDRTRIIGPVVIGEDCTIGEEACIKSAVLWSETDIGAGAKLENCVIGSQTSIRRQASVQRCVITANHGRSVFT